MSVYGLIDPILFDISCFENNLITLTEDLSEDISVQVFCLHQLKWF